MARYSSLALGVALAGGLAACSGNPRIDYTYVSDSYTPVFLSYAAKRGGMLTEVVGNPFEAEKAMLDTQVTDSFENSHFGPRLPFFTEPPEDFSSTYRVVVLFNAAPNANGARLCSDPARPQRTADQSGETVYVLAAFCSSETRVTSARGSLAGANGPDDPAFQRFMGQIGLQLFPPRSPDGPNRDRDFTI